MDKLGYTFYPKDYISDPDVMMMTPAERGVYRDLIDLAYMHNNQIKYNLFQLSRYCNCSEKEVQDVLDLKGKKVGEFWTIPSCEKRIAKAKVNRENGGKGGRPPKPKDNPTDNPTDNPKQTQTERQRERERERESEIESEVKNKTKENNIPTSGFDFLDSLIQLGVDKQVATDWIKVRAKHKASNTQTAFKNIAAEIEKSGRDANWCITKAVEKSWRGFEAGWITPEPVKKAAYPPFKIAL
jgi:uncharacterized protein YdaU (DUF1376 family)